MALSKTDLVASIAELNDISKSQAERNVSQILDTIADCLAEGESINIHGFGNFTVKETEARKGRNPATGDSIDIEASHKVSFKPSKTLKDRIKEL